MKAILFLLIVLFLTGCASTAGGEPVIKTMERYSIDLKVNLFDTKSEMHRAIRARGVQGFMFSNDGAALIHTSSNKCEIFAIRPTSLNDNETLVLGHELLHCIYGEYHR